MVLFFCSEVQKLAVLGQPSPVEIGISPARRHTVNAFIRRLVIDICAGGVWIEQRQLNESSYMREFGGQGGGACMFLV